MPQRNNLSLLLLSSSYSLPRPQAPRQPHVRLQRHRPPVWWGLRGARNGNEGCGGGGTWRYDFARPRFSLNLNSMWKQSSQAYDKMRTLKHSRFCQIRSGIHTESSQSPFRNDSASSMAPRLVPKEEKM